MNPLGGRTCFWRLCFPNGHGPAPVFPGPFGPNCWTLGRSGPIVGPWAIRAQKLDPGPFGPIRCPMPGWSCPIFVWAPFWVPFGDPFVVWGPFGSHLGTHFLVGAYFGSHLGTHLPWDLLGALATRLGGECGPWRPKANFLGVRRRSPREFRQGFDPNCYFLFD